MSLGVIISHMSGHHCFRKVILVFSQLRIPGLLFDYHFKTITVLASFLKKRKRESVPWHILEKSLPCHLSGAPDDKVKRLGPTIIIIITPIRCGYRSFHLHKIFCFVGIIIISTSFTTAKYSTHHTLAIIIIILTIILTITISLRLVQSSLSSQSSSPASSPSSSSSTASCLQGTHKNSVASYCADLATVFCSQCQFSVLFCSSSSCFESYMRRQIRRINLPLARDSSNTKTSA